MIALKNVLLMPVAAGLLSQPILRDSAAAVAEWLCAHGIVADCVIALQLHRTLEQLVGVVGVLLSTGAYMPLDTTWPPSRRLAFMHGAECHARLSHANDCACIVVTDCMSLYDTTLCRCTRRLLLASLSLVSLQTRLVSLACVLSPFGSTCHLATVRTALRGKSGRDSPHAPVEEAAIGQLRSRPRRR